MTMIIVLLSLVEMEFRKNECKINKGCLQILLDPHFSLADPDMFEAIFLEPNLEQPDRLLVDCRGHVTTSGLVTRCDSSASLTPSFPDDARLSAVSMPLAF